LATIGYCFFIAIQNSSVKDDDANLDIDKESENKSISCSCSEIVNSDGRPVVKGFLILFGLWNNYLFVLNSRIKNTFKIQWIYFYN